MDRRILWLIGGGAALIVAGVIAAKRLILKDLSPAFPVGTWRVRKTPPRAIVIHHSSTKSAASTRAVLRARDLSTHFEVDQQGNVYKYLDPATVIAYHVGSANPYSIGIDMTHLTGKPFPEAQVLAARALVQELASTFNITLKVAPDNQKRPIADWLNDGYTLIRHRNLYATACPEHFPMELMVPGPSIV